mgnify:CR=1 FL=1
MTIAEPGIEFSEWILWNPNEQPKTIIQDAGLTDSLQFPGIYLWACAEGKPTAMSIDNPCREITYVGEAKKVLKKRIQQFARSCFFNSNSHQGGRQCGQHLKDSNLNLFLSACSFAIEDENGTPLPRNVWEKPDHWLRPFLHFVERTIIWNYTKHWGQRPMCNRT